ncbi:MAG: right-handed parallel beta-helix repeat-containing protein [Planctomycetota bacterium]
MAWKPFIAFAGLICLAATAGAQDVNVPGDYPTIQLGIDNVGSGGTVFVGPGTYTESLIIDPANALGTGVRGKASMRIEATAPGVVIQWNAGAHALPAAVTSINGTALDYILLTKGVTALELQDLEFTGLDDITTGKLSCGIVLLDSDALLTGCFIHNLQNSPTGWIANGIGLRVEGSTSNVDVVDCSFTSIQHAHVSAVDSATVDLSLCQIIGRGPTASLPQHGVCYGGPGAESDGGGTIDNCFIDGFWFTGGTWRAAGVQNYASGPVTITNNEFEDCQTGVYDYANTNDILLTIDRNVFNQLATYTTGLTPSAMIVEDGDTLNTITISDNRINDHAGPGIAMLTEGATITNNYLNANGSAASNVNCRDDAAALGNDWVGNTYTDFRSNAGWPNYFLVTGAAGARDWDALAPAETAIYGAGNPAGSMMVVAGRPAIGTSFTLGVDNPLGTQAPGSLGLFLFSTLPDANYPNGTPFPGWGMDGGAGQILINLTFVDWSISAVAGIWAGAGSPVPYTLPIPDEPAFVGLRLFAQGVILDLTTPPPGIWIGLARAAELMIGY